MLNELLKTLPDAVSPEEILEHFGIDPETASHEQVDALATWIHLQGEADAAQAEFLRAYGTEPELPPSVKRIWGRR